MHMFLCMLLSFVCIVMSNSITRQAKVHHHLNIFPYTDITNVDLCTCACTIMHSACDLHSQLVELSKKKRKHAKHPVSLYVFVLKLAILQRLPDYRNASESGCSLALR